MSLLCVQTKKGKIEGIQTDGHSAFFGIPYAKAPVGELRFKRPQETEPWQGVFKADRFGNRCLQPGQKEGSFYHKEFWNAPEYQPQENEDCLYLNIWTPAKTAQEKLPVALYIHGGAFVNGAGTNINFDGAAMASRGVILVTMMAPGLGKMSSESFTKIFTGSPRGSRFMSVRCPANCIILSSREESPEVSKS